MSLEKFDSDTLAEDILSVRDPDETGAAVDASIVIIIACAVFGAIFGSLPLGLAIGLGATAGIAAHVFFKTDRAHI